MIITMMDIFTKFKILLLLLLLLIIMFVLVIVLFWKEIKFQNCMQINNYYFKIVFLF